MDFRKKLLEMRDKPEYRQLRRRNGKIEFKDGKHITGPFTIAARQEILKALLAAQEQSRLQLISEEELEFIRKTWMTDVLDSQKTSTK